MLIKCLSCFSTALFSVATGRMAVKGNQVETKQFEETVTCSICKGYLRTPKLLPCGHSFCMEPCMLGLVSKRPLYHKGEMLMCPECNAIHFLPIREGTSLALQCFPNNLAIEQILGSVDPDTGNLNRINII